MWPVKKRKKNKKQENQCGQSKAEIKQKIREMGQAEGWGREEAYVVLITMVRNSSFYSE